MNHCAPRPRLGRIGETPKSGGASRWLRMGIRKAEVSARRRARPVRTRRRTASTHADRQRCAPSAAPLLSRVEHPGKRRRAFTPCPHRRLKIRSPRPFTRHSLKKFAATAAHLRLPPTMLSHVALLALLGIPSAPRRLSRVAPLALLGIPSAALRLESSFQLHLKPLGPATPSESSALERMALKY